MEHASSPVATLLADDEEKMACISPNMYQEHADLGFRMGFRQLMQGGPLLCGFSLGNSYYSKKENLEAILDLLVPRACKIYPFTPTAPSIHTFRAKGCSNPAAKVKDDFKRLSTAIQSAFDKVRQQHASRNCALVALSWEQDIEDSPIYQNSLNVIRQLYEENEAFREDVKKTTWPVIKDSIGDRMHSEEAVLTEAKEFLLKELAFLRVAPEMLNEQSLAFVYHQPWPIFNNLLNGCKYGQQPINNMGFVILTPIKTL